MKTWILYLCIKCQRNLPMSEYFKLIDEKLSAQAEHIEPFHILSLRINTYNLWPSFYLYFQIPAATPYTAIRIIDNWKDYFFEPPDIFHSIQCLGEFSQELFNQIVQHR